MYQSNYYELLGEIRQYIETVYDQHADTRFVYHNLSHVQQVVAAATQMANHYQLSDQEFFVVNAAAWFHDIGYFTDPARHEEKGAEAVADYLTQKQVDKEVIEQVKACIMATRWPQDPKSLPEQIVCDADLFHLGTEDFKEKNKLMRREYELLHDTKTEKNQWNQQTVALFKNHAYKTDYARLLLNEQKKENLEKLKRKISKEAGTAPLPTVKPGNKQPGNAELFDDKVKEKERPNKGIETMFRISSSNHQRLSDMADSKAHIMISTNSIIISVILSVLLRKLEDNPYLTIPVMILLAVCVVTMVFSILATRPSIPEGTFTRQDIDARRTNLLFFGNFYKMSLDDYTGGMQRMMNDKEFLYGSLIKDVYFQGVVLGKKYKLLRISYNVFMFGITASVIAFMVATMIGK
jgi:predicted metal-dependent HD superfamily phosphohydrolase